MKRYTYPLYFSLLSTLLLITGCADVLDIAPRDRYSESTAYANIKNLDLYVKSFYGVLLSPNTAEIRSDGKMSELYTDLMKPTFYNQPFSNNDKVYYEPSSFTQGFVLDNWADMYGRIKRINEFLSDYNRGLTSHLPDDEVRLRVGEARFWRAFAYQELIPRFGGVVLRIAEDKVDDQHDKSKSRASEKDSWDFVILEYKRAIELLPESWSDADLGRVTKSTAWALIARAALYAQLWDEALAAAAEVDKSGKYHLLDNYGAIFTQEHNGELILAAYFDKPNLQHRFDKYYGASADFKNNEHGVVATPTDEFASTFEIKIGDVWQEFDWDEVIRQGINPWKERDPRFYATILHNGAAWKRLVDAPAKRWEPRHLELYAGGTDGFHHFNIADNTTRSTTTGYVVRKYLQYDEAETDFTTVLSDQYWIEMRYAELILIRAEALARKQYFAQAYQELNKLRTTRASVQLPPLKVKTSWSDFLSDLQKERIRELGLEGHRFWDLRRWGIAQKTLQGSRRHGIEISKSGDTFTYKRIVVDTRDLSFPDRYTINPIPLAEIHNNSLIKQNDLWK